MEGTQPSLMAGVSEAEQEPTQSVGRGSPTMDFSSGESACSSLRIFVSFFPLRQGNSIKCVNRI